MRKTNFSLAGFAAILSATVLIPLFIFQIYADITGAKILSRVISLIGLVLYVYVFVRLKDLLHNHEQHEADGLIDLGIGVNVVGTILTLFISESSGFGTFLGVLFFIGIGILYVLIGIKILNTSSELHGLKKALGITTIITGVCFASILFAVFAIIAAMAMNVMLGIVFFKEEANPSPSQRVEPHLGHIDTTSSETLKISAIEDWATTGRRHRAQSSTTIFISIFAAIVIAGLVIWFAQVLYAKREMEKIQQQTAIKLQQIQAQALAQQARIRAEQQQRIEAERQWKREHPTIVGYTKTWIPGRPLSECKQPGQAMDNATVACINGHYENLPIYSSQ